MDIELQTAAVALCVALPLTFALRLPTKTGRRGEQMPRIGGLSILGGFVASILIMALFSDHARRLVGDDRREFLVLVASGAVVCAVGARDDFKDLDWRYKMSTHFLAALGIYLAGFRIGETTLPGGGTLALGWMDPVVSIFWVMLITNSINLIDGRDGVAAGVAALVSSTMSYIAWYLGHDLIAMLFAALAGASLGFVPLNLPQAKRFLGDSRSLLPRLHDRRPQHRRLRRYDGAGAALHPTGWRLDCRSSIRESRSCAAISMAGTPSSTTPTTSTTGWSGRVTPRESSRS